jgi:hypothetical protein
VAAETKIDPMHQFQIDPIFGQLGPNNPFAFTNSSLWMLVLLALITGFMVMGMRRELVPGRWQVAAEGLVGFMNSMVESSIGPQGRTYLPWILHGLHLHPVRQFRRRHAVRGGARRAPLHRHQPVHGHRRDVDHQLRHRARSRLLEARPSLLLAVRPQGHAVPAKAADHAGRVHQLRGAPVQSLGYGRS